MENLSHQNKILRSAFAKHRLLLAMLLLFSLLLTLNSWLKPLVSFDNIWLDFAVKKWSKLSYGDPNIVLIDIDDPSLKAMQNSVGRWPWPRAVHAELIDYISQQKPQAIVFDLLFSEPDIYQPDSDLYLSEVIASQSNIFLPILHFESQQNHLFPKLADYPASVGLTPPDDVNQTEVRANLLLPSAIHPAAWKLGTINFIPDHDGIGRRYHIEHKIQGWTIDTLPTKVARYLGAPIPNQDELLLDWKKPVAQEYSSPYARFSYANVYKAVSEERPFHTPNLFENKIVLIGSTATGLHDLKHTPLSASYPGLYILATAIDNLLHQEQLAKVPTVIEWLLSIIFLFAITISLLVAKRVIPATLTCGILVLGCYATSYLLASQKWLLVVNSSIALILVYFLSVLVIQFLQRQREYAYAIDIFGRFMDRNVVRQLVDSGQTKQALQAKNRKVTVLFSDIRNFTTLSEQHTPLEIVQLLDDYFSMQVNVIFQHNGTLDKFIGDAIMAFWGAPLDNEQQEKQAIQAALEMVDKLEQFRIQQNLPEFNIGIGIHTGEVVVGAIGGEQRYDYTVIGDPVNVASRIEGVTKNRCNILVSSSTRDACIDDFEFEEMGSHSLKGREEPVTLYIPSKKKN
ncbi:adenylate/guanylate cyclase domain-containing protein [Vibrio sp. T187]|uniref:adenylate/guanylate cyclase domain-containing protein n=1 Tax=Vibrio TaxID=662 RepID=UPI0010C9D310|nr:MULTISPECIES: adenylate/guanylate cyclase domain-containing protein [Vibrio]MBW3695414.1 adenylate/guanylate cyclase domain-containing protein [Vibrio sp. T187]